MPLATEKANFVTATKLVLKAIISINEDTLRTHKNTIIEKFNLVVRYIKTNYDSVSPDDQKRYKKELNYVRNKLQQCLDKLKSSFEIPEDIFEEINTEDVHILEELDTNTDEEYEETMTLTQPELMKLTNGHLNKPYSGDPLTLTSFVDSIKLLDSLADTAPLKTFLVTILKTKIDGRAREFLTGNETTTDEIITILQNNIKPDSSKVIAGRILSLRLTSSTQEDFASKAESLSEAFRRSLIIEGMTPAKATEMTIDKTVELCRSNARTDLVKSVLEASAFTNPKDVIAKLITQLDKSKQEYQVLSFKKPQHNRNFNNNRTKYQKNRFNQNRGNFHNNNFQNNNFRQNYPNNNNRYNRYHNKGQNHSNVRVATNSGNGGTTPATMRMGYPNNQDNQVQQ